MLKTSDLPDEAIGLIRQWSMLQYRGRWAMIQEQAALHDELQKLYLATVKVEAVSVEEKE